MQSIPDGGGGDLSHWLLLISLRHELLQDGTASMIIHSSQIHLWHKHLTVNYSYMYMFLVQLVLTLQIPVRMMTLASLYSNHQPAQQDFFFSILSYSSFWELWLRCYTWNVAAPKATRKSCVHRVQISDFVLLLALLRLIRVFWDIMTYHTASGSPWHTVIPEDLNAHERHHENPKSHIHIAVWNISVQLLATWSSKTYKSLLHNLHVCIMHQ
jgi:hypothetical protein